jgi:hypothetical protein
MPKLPFLFFPRSCLIAVLCLLLSACADSEFPLEPTTEAEIPTEAPSPTDEATAIACTYSAALDGDAGSESISAQPDQTVQKMWKLRNDGSCDWQGVMLVLVAASDQGGIPVAETAAESSVEVVVELAAPAGTGVYGGEFRLRAPDGTLFGPTLHTELIVGPAALSAPPQQSAGAVTTDAGCTLDAAFVADITLGDGAVVQPNEALQKIWRVQNTGTCDWPEDMTLVFVSGALASSDTVTIPPTTSGQTADIQIKLTAPAQNGAYTGIWRLQSADGTPFGVLLYTEISVGAGAAAPADNRFAAFINNISFHSREIFLNGQTKGNQANIFTKVGDSITDVPFHLIPIGNGNYILHEYDYLQPVINFFSGAPVRGGNSFNNKSLAATWGWSSVEVLSSYFVESICPGKSSLECELTQVKPSVAIILIGTNDALSARDTGTYEANLRRIVEICIENGVIPVLSTVPWDQHADVQPYNQVIITTAIAYDVPWMDFYGATYDLENHGIDWGDGVHPSVPPTNDPTNFTGDNLRYGHTVRNLLVLHVLDRMWREVLAY